MPNLSSQAVNDLNLQVFLLRGEPGAFTEIVKAETEVRPPEPSQELESTGSTVQAGVKVANRPFNPTRLSELYYQSSVHASCCDVKAEDTVGGGYSMCLPDGSELDEPLEEAIRKVVDRSADALVESATDGGRIGWSNFELIPTRGGELYRFEHVDAHTNWQAVDCAAIVHLRDNKTRRFAPVGVHLPGVHQMAWLDNKTFFKNTYYGAPDAVSVLLEIDLAHEALKHNSEFFKRGGGYRWLMMLEGDAPANGYGGNQTAENALIERVNFQFKEAGKDSNTDLMIIPLPDGRVAKLTQLDNGVRDLDFPALFRLTRDQILIAHRTPPIKVGIVEDGALGGSNAIQQMKAYRQSVITPKQRRWNTLIEDIILDWWGVEVKFAFTPLEIDDFAALVFPAIAAFNAGILDRAETREVLGKGDVDEGYQMWADEAPSAASGLSQMGGGADPTTAPQA